MRVWPGSSAALGICSRQGLGKLRHLDTHTLWVQQAVRSGRLQLKKVPGESNPADLLTKHSISQEKAEQLIKLYDCYYRNGRAESAPAMRTGASEKPTLAKAGQGSELGVVGANEPCMPHNLWAQEELDARYPSLRAVADLELDDLSRLEDERLYAAGMSVVQQVLEEMTTHGRRRRAPADAMPREAHQGQAEINDAGRQRRAGAQEELERAEPLNSVVLRNLADLKTLSPRRSAGKAVPTRANQNGAARGSASESQCLLDTGQAELP